MTPPALISDCFAKDKGPWIIKPVASSRGRGIYLVSNVSRLGFHLSLLLSKSPLEKKLTHNTSQVILLKVKSSETSGFKQPKSSWCLDDDLEESRTSCEC